MQKVRNSLGYFVGNRECSGSVTHKVLWCHMDRRQYWAFCRGVW